MLFFNKLCFSNIARACPLIPSINTTLFSLPQPYQTSQQAAENCQNKENLSRSTSTISFFNNSKNARLAGHHHFELLGRGHLNLQGQGLNVPVSAQIHPLSSATLTRQIINVRQSQNTLSDLKPIR